MTIKEKTQKLLNQLQFFEDVAPLLKLTPRSLSNLCINNGNKKHSKNLHKLLDAQLELDNKIKNMKVDFEEIIKTK
jgi:hypothetical protein